MDKKTLYRWSNPEVILVATNLADGTALIPHAVSQAKTHNARILLAHAIAPAELSVNERRGLPFAIALPRLAGCAKENRQDGQGTAK